MGMITNSKWHFRNTIWILISLLVLILDQFSKHWVMQHLNLHETRPLTFFLSLTLTFNQGAAFSFLHQLQNVNAWFIGFSSLMLVFMLFVLWTTSPEKKLALFAWSFVIGGAFANLLDRIRFSAVVDFIHVYWKDYHFAIFNVADSAICLGAFLLAICYRKLD